MMKKHESDIPKTEKEVPNEMNVRKSNFKGLQSQAKSLNFVDILLSNDFDVTEGGNTLFIQVSIFIS